MPVAVLRGHPCSWRVHGTRGPRVLLVMGFGMVGEAWRPIRERLEADHVVCTYDVRGIGGSAAGDPGPVTLADLADDAAALLDHLGWDHAHVAGISMGGMIAQHLALRHRPRVRSLALLATHAGGLRRATLPTPRGLAFFLLANLTRGPARLRALDALLVPRGVPWDRAATYAGDELERMLAPVPAVTRRRHLAAILAHDTRTRLHELAGLPTLVVRPARDVLIPPGCSDELAALVPGARLLDVRDGGHGLVTHRPDIVADALRALIRDAG